MSLLYSYSACKSTSVFLNQRPGIRPLERVMSTQPMTMRLKNFRSFFVLFLLLVSSASVHAYDRLGSDLGPGFAVSSPTECAMHCDANASCQSWTFVIAGIKLPTSPTCFLKNGVPDPGFNPTCPTNTQCKSGFKAPSQQWCGDAPQFTFNGVTMGQGVVVNCAAGKTCQGLPSTWHRPFYCLFFPFLNVCQPPHDVGLDWYCQ